MIINKLLNFLIAITFLIILQGCAGLQDQSGRGSMADSIARIDNIDRVYVNNWLKARNASAQALIGKTPEEVKAILGKPSDGETRHDCTPNGGLPTALRRNPNDRSVLSQLKYWCEEDHMLWSYNIPRWFYLYGNTFITLMFENGKVILVGSPNSKLAEE